VRAKQLLDVVVHAVVAHPANVALGITTRSAADGAANTHSAAAAAAAAVDAAFVIGLMALVALVRVSVKHIVVTVESAMALGRGIGGERAIARRTGNAVWLVSARVARD